jgi:hypothetical protein
MSNEQVLLNCTFGWGKTCRLYLDTIEIAGKIYNLDDLTSISPTYRTVFGVPSARLELFFGLHRRVLRGISDIETVRRLVSHLQPYCSAEPRTGRTRAAQARNLARAQAHAWERTNKLPAIPLSPDENLASSPSGSLKRSALSQPLSLFEDEIRDTPAGESLLSEVSSAIDNELIGREPAFSCADGVSSLAEGADEHAAAVSGDLADVPNSWPALHSQHLRTPRFQPPLHSVHLVSPGQRMQDTSSMPVPAIKSNVLPVIHVPVRLQPGECAHYSIGAALCSDRVSGSERAPYPPLDHGLLILTNRRIFYIGKRSQLILAYTHLWYVSLLHNAIALHIEQQFRRIIIELEHPQEWASRIEQLSFIARRARPRAALPTLLMTALPGLPSSSLGATLKRPVLKVPAAQEQTPLPPLPERTAKIVEASTISLDEPEERVSAAAKTQDLPASATEAIEHTPQLLAPAEALVERASERLEAAPELAKKLSQESLSQGTLVDRPTQEFTPHPDTGEMSTQEFPPPLDLSDRDTLELEYTPDLLEVTTQELAPYPALADVPTQELRRLSAEEIEDFPRTSPLGEDEEAAQEVISEELTWNGRDYEEIDTLPLYELNEEREDGTAPTISLRKWRTVSARARQRAAPISDRLPDIDATARRIPRLRRSRLPVATHHEEPDASL